MDRHHRSSGLQMIHPAASDATRYDEVDVRFLEAVVCEAWRQLRVSRHLLAQRDLEETTRMTLARAVIRQANRGIRERQALVDAAVKGLDGH